MDREESEKIERALLSGKWGAGVAPACFSEGRAFDIPMLNFVVEDFTSEQRQEALHLLKEKFEVYGYVKRSNFMDNRLVIRVEGLLNIEKLAPHLVSKPEIPTPPERRLTPNAFFYRKKL